MSVFLLEVTKCLVSIILKILPSFPPNRQEIRFEPAHLFHRIRHHPHDHHHLQWRQRRGGRHRHRAPLEVHPLQRAARGHPLRPVPLRAQPQVLLPVLAREHQVAGGGQRQRGVLPQRREVPAGRLVGPLGLHAGRDSDHPRRRAAQDQEGEGDIKR